MKVIKRFFVVSLALALVIAFVPLSLGDDIEKIDINKASVEELMQLERIGPKYAERIVEYRKVHGSFERVEDIMKVPGIGPKTFDANKDLISVE